MNVLEDAKRAKEVLDNPAYKEAMLHVKHKIFSEWSKQTIWSGKKKREKLWDMMQAANEFEAFFERALTNGKIYLKEEERKERLKRVK